VALATRIPVSLVVLAIFTPACGGAQPRGIEAPAPQARESGPARSAPTLPPPTREEAEVAGRLRETVTRLAVGIGARDGASVWNLATATDELTALLERMGYEVRRQGFDVGDAVAQNLEVTVSGGARGKEVVVVGAHFDTVALSPGANDNASGVAGLVELARAFRSEKPSRTLRFAFFTHEEEPYSGTPQMGSVVYAKGLAKEEARVTGMMSLDSIGFYSTAHGSQRYPKELAAGRSLVGDFVAVVGNEGSRALLDQVTGAMKLHATLPVVAEVLPADAPGAIASDHSSFWQMGFPAILVTDTALHRDPEYHRAGDLPDRLDFDRMARVVVGLRKAILALVGEEGPLPAARPPSGDSVSSSPQPG